MAPGGKTSDSRDPKSVNPVFVRFWTTNDSFSSKLAVTILLQDQWASLSIPADPGRVFHPVRRPQSVIL